MAQATPVPLTPRQQRAHYKVRAAVTDFELGRAAAARAKLQDALDLDHECVDGRLWLAHVLMHQGEPEPALKQYEAGLVFAPGDSRLTEAATAASTAAVGAEAPEARDRRLAKKRLVPNLILSALIPPSGVLLGLWEIVFGRTKEWKDLGLKTLLASLAAAVGWIIVVGFLLVVSGGIDVAGP